VALLPSMQCSVLKTLCKGLREKFPSNHVARILRLVGTEGAFITLMAVGTISRGDQFETLVEGRVRAVHCMIVAILCKLHSCCFTSPLMQRYLNGCDPFGNVLRTSMP
jgi:hypothetical protein